MLLSICILFWLNTEMRQAFITFVSRHVCFLVSLASTVLQYQALNTAAKWVRKRKRRKDAALAHDWMKIYLMKIFLSVAGFL